MSLKKKFESMPGVVITGAVIAVLFAGMMTYRSMQSARAKVMVPRWAYDLNTGKILIAGSDQLAPFNTGSGPFDYPGMQQRGAGVDAHIYTCGDPDEIEEGMTVEDLTGVGARLIFVTRYPDETIDAFESLAAGNDVQGNIDTDARLLSDLTGQNWVPHMSPAAFKLREKAIAKCPSGEYPILVEP